MAKQNRRVDEIRRLVKSVCKPVVMPREFKKRLLERLWLEAFNKQLLERLVTKGKAGEGGRQTENQGL